MPTRDKSSKAFIEIALITVVETNIAYPTDARLLWDSARVLTRIMERIRRQMPHQTLQSRGLQTSVKI
jgi:hypothetical protein